MVMVVGSESRWGYHEAGPTYSQETCGAASATRPGATQKSESRGPRPGTSALVPERRLITITGSVLHYLEAVVHQYG